jgi:hypothetical protein
LEDPPQAATSDAVITVADMTTRALTIAAAYSLKDTTSLVS